MCDVISDYILGGFIMFWRKFWLFGLWYSLTLSLGQNPISGMVTIVLFFDIFGRYYGTFLRYNYRWFFWLMMYSLISVECGGEEGGLYELMVPQKGVLQKKSDFFGNFVGCSPRFSSQKMRLLPIFFPKSCRWSIALKNKEI